MKDFLFLHPGNSVAIAEHSDVPGQKIGAQRSLIGLAREGLGYARFGRPASVDKLAIVVPGSVKRAVARNPTFGLSNFSLGKLLCDFEASKCFRDQHFAMPPATFDGKQPQFSSARVSFDELQHSLRVAAGSPI